MAALLLVATTGRVSSDLAALVKVRSILVEATGSPSAEALGKAVTALEACSADGKAEEIVSTARSGYTRLHELISQKPTDLKKLQKAVDKATKKVTEVNDSDEADTYMQSKEDKAEFEKALAKAQAAKDKAVAKLKAAEEAKIALEPRQLLLPKLATTADRLGLQAQIVNKAPLVVVLDNW